MERQPLTSHWQKLFHVIALIGGWAIFLWLWWYVLFIRTIDFRLIGTILLVSVFSFPLLTLFWMLHGLTLFRKKQPREKTPRVVERYTKDWGGRQIIADFKQLKTSRSIEIEVGAIEKHYKG